MYKIVIADDDEIQLQGMCCAFPWDSLDIEVAAGVDDGDKALQAVIEQKADILLTDIKMTNMDGLYLTEQIRKQSPHTRVVIMSAYDDFQFAQKALRLGVDDYLLKPVDLHHMQETMRQIVYQKDEEKKRLEMELHSKRVEQIVSENEQFLEDTFFQNVLSQKYTREACRRMEEEFMANAQQSWQVLEVLISQAETKDKKQEILKRISQERGYKYIYSLGHHLVCCCSQSETIENEAESLKQECRSQFREYDDLDQTSFIDGTIVSELYYLGLSYQKIIQIRNYQVVEAENKDLSERDLDTYFNENHTLNKALAEYLAKLVLMGNTDMLSGYVGKLKDNLRIAGSDSILMLSFSLSLIFGELRGLVEKALVNEDTLDEMYYKIIRQNSLDCAMELLEKELYKIAELSCREDNISVEQSIKRACDYIEKHYFNPSLRIGEVALEVGFSQNYFSAVFTEMTGESFTDYLIKMRMKEAQLLLTTTDYKIQEIGFSVGYENPAYFSAAFKKFTGVSVSQYREMIKGI